MEDEKIVQLYLDRDEAAIAQTAEQYGGRLRRLAFGITGNTQTSEECENDTYLLAWNSIPPHEPRTYFFAFLSRMTRHIAIDRCRALASLKRQAHVMELTEELAQCLPASEDVESIMDAKLLGETINGFLASLPKEKRILFMRRYYYLDSVAEISAALSLSESKVKTTLFRLRKDLGHYLKKEGYII